MKQTSNPIHSLNNIHYSHQNNPKQLILNLLFLRLQLKWYPRRCIERRAMEWGGGLPKMYECETPFDVEKKLQITSIYHPRTSRRIGTEPPAE